MARTRGVDIDALDREDDGRPIKKGKGQGKGGKAKKSEKTLVEQSPVVEASDEDVDPDMLAAAMRDLQQEASTSSSPFAGLKEQLEAKGSEPVVSEPVTNLDEAQGQTEGSGDTETKVETETRVETVAPVEPEAQAEPETSAEASVESDVDLWVKAAQELEDELFDIRDAAIEAAIQEVESDIAAAADAMAKADEAMAEAERIKAAAETAAAEAAKAKAEFEAQAQALAEAQAAAAATAEAKAAKWGGYVPRKAPPFELSGR